MLADAALIQDLELHIAQRPEPDRSRALSRITDLFVAGAALLNEEHVAVFDDVIMRLADEIEQRARAELADRLADLPNAPARTMRRLAHDDILVARPVLARSQRLTDQDLVSVAMTRGRDHMLAISERPALSEPVTSVLVTRGDRVVVNALAANQGAAFSNESFEALVGQAREDELLHAALRNRSDLPSESVVTLVAIAKDYARRRLERTPGVFAGEQMERVLETSASLVAQSAGAGPQPRNFSAAVRRVAERLAEGKLSEKDVLEYARAKLFEETVCALAALASVSVPMVTRIFATSENDMLLVIGRTLNFEWPTVKQLLVLSAGGKSSDRAIQTLAENYARLTPATADRVLRFMHMREAAKTKSVGRRA